MADVDGSENSLALDVSPDEVQGNSDNQFADGGNQTNFVTLDIKEDSNNQLGDAAGNQPSSVSKDVNPIEAEEDAAGNQPSSETQDVNPIEAEEDAAGNQPSSETQDVNPIDAEEDAAGNQPSSETQDVNPIEAEEDAGNQVNSIDTFLYYRATKGDFDAFEQRNVGSLTQLVTRVDENTILHICITAATPHYEKKTARSTENNESTDFVKKALAKCKELLWQPNKKGETILHIAARHGHHDIVQVLLAEDKEARHNGQAVNRPQRLLEMKNKVGDTALHEAVRCSHLRVVKILVNEDRNYQCGQNNDGETPLYIAAEMGARDVVQEILIACQAPAYQGPHGRTALHAAVLCNNYEIVELLLKKFKKLVITTIADNSGWTPLHCAAQRGFPSIVELLLKKDKNAAYMAEKNEEKTALHVAASEGKAKVVKEFMLACPDCFEQVDKNGRNALHFAVEANRSRYDHTLKLILDNECFSNLINAKDDFGNTPLHHLANSNYPLAVDLIFHPKLNARVFNRKNLSPLEVIFPQKSKASIWTVFTSIALRLVGNTPRRQIRDEDEGKEGGGIKDQDGIKKDELDQETKDKKARNRTERFYSYVKDINLLISILIATVTFAAGFTIPGGYMSDKSPNEAGYPVLIRKPAFMVFVFSNTIAFILASSGVVLHLSWILYTSVSVFASAMSLWCNFFAIIGMVVAFVSGTCAVLAPYPSLVIAICVPSAFLLVLIYLSQTLGVCYFWFVLRGKERARRRLLSKY